MKITCGHTDPLNMRAAFMLNGVHPPDKQTLVDLFKSDVPLDRATREAIAEALERESGLRLELIREKGFPNKPSLVSEAAIIAEYQEIAAEVETEAQREATRLGAAKITRGHRKAAKQIVAERRHISLGKMKDALREAERTRTVRVTRVEH